MGGDGQPASGPRAALRRGCGRARVALPAAGGDGCPHGGCSGGSAPQLAAAGEGGPWALGAVRDVSCPSGWGGSPGDQASRDAV